VGDGATEMVGPTSPWNSIAIGAGGFVDGIVFSPAQKGLAYARTDVGGFYRWDDANSRWIPLTDFLSMAQQNYFGGESIAPDPTNAQIVYAAGGTYEGSDGVIMRSTDQGNTWTLNPIAVEMGGNEGGRGMGERLAVDPNNNTVLFFGTRKKGLYKSTNSGTSFAAVAGFPTSGDSPYGLPVVVFDPASKGAAGSMNIYVAAATTGATSNLYKTTDGGQTWAVVAGGPSGLMAHHAALGSDGTLWLAYSSDYGPGNNLGGTLSGQVWKYAPGAGTWTNVTPSTNWGGMAGGISVDAQNPQHVIVATLSWYAPDVVLSTSNGGTAWTVISHPPVSYSNAGPTYDIQGALFWTVYGLIGTGATNWVEALALDPFNSNRAMYGTGAGVWTSTDILADAGPLGEGLTWTFLDKGLEMTVPIFLVPSVHGAFLGAIGDLGGMRNTNLDEYSSTGEYSNPIDNNTNGIDFAESNPNFVVRVGQSPSLASDVAYSTDNGVTWMPCATAVPGYSAAGYQYMQSVAVAADGSRFVVSPYAGNGSAAWTADMGATWTTSTGLPSGAALAADRVTAGTFYATSGGTLYVSTDGGATFKMANTFTGAGAPRTVFGQAGEVWVASSGGGSLYRFTDAGATQTVVASVSSANGVGFGMAAPGQTHPATYIVGTVAGQYGFFRSTDGIGTAWTRINDDAHQYGPLQGCYIAGDETVYGRVYLTTGGRGYICGNVP